MTDESPDSTTPEERAQELSRLLQSHGGVNSVSDSADDDGAIVTCYAYLDHASAIKDLAVNSNFDVVHEHEVADEVHYVFGYSAAETETR